MTLALESNAFLMGIEYLAIFCWGLLGGLAAIRKRYDLFAVLLTSWLTALGGGVIRDVLLGIFPPPGIVDKRMVLTALVASIVVACFHPEVGKMYWSMLVLDGVALGLFAVNGTAKALVHGTSGMTAIFLGMVTALGGGLIRDTLLNEVSVVIADRHWYAVPTLIACIFTVLVTRGFQSGRLSFEDEVFFDLSIVCMVLALRLLSVKFNWVVPGALQRNKHQMEENTQD